MRPKAPATALAWAPARGGSPLCNFLDDDCDGLVDEDASCSLGETCQLGACAPEENGNDGEASDGGEGSSTDGSNPGSNPAETGSGGGCEVASSTPGTRSFALWMLAALVPIRRRGSTLE